jgi:nucleotide-binding universal stress UspA family protein
MLQSFPIGRILFPTDFSKSSEAAAAYTAALAAAAEAKVWLLNVVPCLSSWHGASEPYFDLSGDDERRGSHANEQTEHSASLKTILSFQKQHFGNVASEVCVKRGAVAESITEYANDIEADLIVMPTRGWGPIRRFLIGSTTAKLLHDSRRPVLTSAHPRELEPFRPYRHVVCAMDYRSPSRDLPLRAMQVAQSFNSRLSIVSAIPCPGMPDVPCSGRKSVQPMKRETINTLKALVRDLGIKADVNVLEGSVGEVVREAAVADDADLIVIAHGHLDEPMGHLRTHAYEIVWNAPCPVLVV